MNIDAVLEELYMIEPELRTEEAELKDIIGKLIEKRPDAEPDDVFRNRLKAELLEKIEHKKRRAGFFVIHRKSIVQAAGIAAVLIIVLFIAVRPALLRNAAGPEQMQAAEAGGTIADEDVFVAESAAGVRKDAEKPKEEIPVQDEVPPAAAETAPVTEYEKRSAVQAPEPMMLKEQPAAELMAFSAGSEIDDFDFAEQVYVSEEYGRITENDFIFAANEPVSTFSIDVDTASYSNVRRYINSGRLPPPDAVRIEELINYFDYEYPLPESGRPFSITTELAECPWNNETLLLHVGLQGYRVEREQLPPSNIVFLLDSSGSMKDENKLPLLKQSIALLLETLRSSDRVSIVAYAGSAGLVLPPTPGDRSAEILAAVDGLEAGGSTAGGAGIELAYRTAAANLMEDGNNRVILATDGDFNVGQSTEDELTAMIEARRDQGIYLTVLGLGMGNYKDARMEALADNGNGNYAYIDTLNEANKVLITEFSSTMLTIAKDVKIQIDFNESAVDSYRLIGYENRLMAAADFDDDSKDAGEIGAGHSVTALYEVVPAESAADSGELAEIRFRYKNPDETQSRLLTESVSSVPVVESSDNFRLSAAVAEWGMLLRGSGHSGNSDIAAAAGLASTASGTDRYGYRAEFIELLNRTAEIINREE